MAAHFVNLNTEFSKFKVGDKVKVVNSGSGVGGEEMGKVVTISEVGTYCHEPGYKVEPAIGNSKSGFYDGFIGECSFELVESSTELTSLPEKWYIKLTPDNHPIVYPFYDKQTGSECYDYYKIGYMTSHNFSGEVITGSGNSRKTSYHQDKIPDGYTEITFDQFKKWVLKESETSVTKQTNNLLEEAKRRYPVGTKFRVVHEPNVICTVENHETYPYLTDTLINLYIIEKYDSPGATVYKDGKWAKIIEMPNSVPEYVEVFDNGKSYTTHSAAKEIGVVNYDVGNCATNGEVYKVVKEELKYTNEPAYVLQSYSGKGYIVGKKGCRVSTREAYEAQKQKKYKEAYGFVYSQPRRFGMSYDAATGYASIFPDYFKKSSSEVKPSSKVSVKSHEEFKINIIKPKTIKL